jgi:hypothetical protein
MDAGCQLCVCFERASVGDEARLAHRKRKPDKRAFARRASHGGLGRSVAGYELGKRQARFSRWAWILCIGAVPWRQRSREAARENWISILVNSPAHTSVSGHVLRTRSIFERNLTNAGFCSMSHNLLPLRHQKWHQNGALARGHPGWFVFAPDCAFALIPASLKLRRRLGERGRMLT